MRFLLDQFESHRDQGMAAYKAGKAEDARHHLLKAAEFLFKLAQKSEGHVRDRRMESARRLFTLGKSIDPAKPIRQEDLGGDKGDGEDAETTASKWIITDKPGVRFDEVAGLDDVKALIRRRVIYPFQNPEVARRYKKRAGGGVLLYGPPGTGKTMIAKAIATELDATFFTVKCSDIMSKWVGQAEQNLSALFTAARERERAAIFMDETEAIVARRGGQSTVMNRVIPEFLAQVDGLDTGHSTLLLLGATNRPWDMDEAALRTGRFGELIYVGPPDYDARLWLLRHGLDGVPVSPAIDLESLARRLDSYTGADIKGLLERAKDFPFEREIESKEPSQVEPADIDAALGKTRRSVTPRLLAKYGKFREAR